MMLSLYLKKENIIVNIPVASKKKIVETLVMQLAGGKFIQKRYVKEIIKGILKREALGSTAIGQGVALPHIKTSRVKDIVIAFASSRDGVEFNSLDGEPTHIVFMILANPDKEEDYTRILTNVAQFLNDPYFRRDLLSAKDALEVLNCIRKKESST